MTDIREKLAIVTTHGVEIGKTYGGLPNITWEDVVGELKGLPLNQSELLLAKYAGHPRHRVLAYWHAHLGRQGWSLENGQLLAFAKLTLGEHLMDARCKDCNGVKELVIDEKVNVCSRCDGRGYEMLSDNKIAKALGYAANSLDWKWKDRLVYARMEIQRWEIVAVLTVQALVARRR